MAEATQVREVLNSWGLENEVVDRFIDGKMDMFAIQHIDEETIRDLIVIPGQRIRFKTNHSKWVKSLTMAETTPEAPTTSCASINNPELPDPNGNILLWSSLSDDMLSLTTPCEDFTVLTCGDSEIPSVPAPTNPSSTCGSISAALASAPTPSTTCNKRSKIYDLAAVLQQSDKGKKVLALYKANKFEVDGGRQMLADVIISHELSDNVSKSITRERFQFLAKEIVTLFPTENLECWYEVYRHPQTKKTVVKGRLVWRFYNARRSYFKCGLLTKSATTTKCEEEFEEGTDEDLQSCEGSVLWLKQNVHPWNTVQDLWRKTAKSARLRELIESKKEMKVGDYVSQYPAFKESLGYTLFEIDFAALYPHVDSMVLFSEWAALSSFLVHQIQLKEPDFLKDSVYTSDERILRTLLSFSKLFSVVTVVKTKGKQWRPSKAEAQDGFLLHVESIPKLQEHLDKKMEKLFSLGLSQQPIAAVIGPVENPIQNLVVVDRFFFEVESPLKAIDIVFKCYQALHTNYPSEADQIWHFVQKAVYKIDTKYDRHYSSVSSLLGRYRAFKNS